MRRPLLLAASLIVAAGATAQSPVDRERLTTIGRTRGIDQAPALNLARNGRGETFAPWSPGSADLGEQRILKRMDAYEPFSLAAGLAAYLTDNVALVSAGEEADTFLVGTLVASWRPRVTRRLYGEISVSEQIYRYNEYDALDFEALKPAAGFTLVTDWLGGLTLAARYSYTRYTAGDSGDTINETHALALAFQKPFVYSRGLWFYVGAGAKLALHTDPEVARRHETDLQAGLNADLTRWLELQVYARSSVFDYPEYDRTDFNHILGANLNFKLVQQITASLFASASFNRSDVSVFDYDVLNPGIGVAVNLRF